MAYTVTQVATAADLALAIAAIDSWMELVEVAEVDGGYWIITEPEDDMPMMSCCCDCHNVESAPTESMYMSYDNSDFVKNINDAIDKIGLVLKTVKR